MKQLGGSNWSFPCYNIIRAKCTIGQLTFDHVSLRSINVIVEAVFWVHKLFFSDDASVLSIPIRFYFLICPQWLWPSYIASFGVSATVSYYVFFGHIALSNLLKVNPLVNGGLYIWQQHGYQKPRDEEFCCAAAWAGSLLVNQQRLLMHAKASLSVTGSSC